MFQDIVRIAQERQFNADRVGGFGWIQAIK